MAWAVTWVVAWPLLAALLLAGLAGLAVPRAGPRTLAAMALAASLPTPVLAATALLSPLQGSLRGSDVLWLQDRLALSLQLVLAVPLVAVSVWRLLEGVRAPRPWRYWPAAAQLLTAGSLIAVGAAWLFPMLAGLTLVAAGLVLLLPRRGQPGPLPTVLLLGALLLTAWLGIACLAAGQGGAAGWIALQANPAGMAPALRQCGVVLLALPVLLLAWTASAGLAGGRDPGADELSARALLPVLAGAPALDIVLRLRALPDIGPTLLLRPGVLLPAGGGLLGIVLACALMPAQPRQADRLMLTASLQLAVAAVGFGIGGTGGVLAGLLLLGGLALALPAALLPVPTRLGRAAQRLAVLVLAGLPPFVPFAAGLVLLLRLSAAAPVAALVALAGLAVGGRLLATARPDPGPGADGLRAGGLGAAAIPAVPALALPLLALALSLLSLALPLLSLALLGWLGLAMPPGVSAWLLAASEDVAGAPIPVPAGPP